jgi:hypothetical protein
MALTGNTVQSTYLDLVQLEQSGAGLPSHAGKEAALYDGSGAQIIGRSAQRHWLDPHPDAIAGSWEFSTYGDANQAALETAGWTFTNCSGLVANGLLQLTATSAAVAYASLVVSLAGDFDFVAAPVYPYGYAANPITAYWLGGVCVGDSSGDTFQGSFVAHVTYGYLEKVHTGTLSTLTGTAVELAVYGPIRQVRVLRISGNVRITGSIMTHPGIRIDDSSPIDVGWAADTIVADATTFNRIILPVTIGTSPNGSKMNYHFLRRFQ